jgi:COP9 signalosome complex subunit 5
MLLQYYSLDVSFFKSGLDSHLLDLLWNKYWVNTLSTSPLIANREFAAGQIADIAEKLEQVRQAWRIAFWQCMCMLSGGKWGKGGFGQGRLLTSLTSWSR